MYIHNYTRESTLCECVHTTRTCAMWDCPYTRVLRSHEPPWIRQCVCVGRLREKAEKSVVNSLIPLRLQITIISTLFQFFCSDAVAVNAKRSICLRLLCYWCHTAIYYIWFWHANRVCEWKRKISQTEKCCLDWKVCGTSTNALLLCSRALAEATPKKREKRARFFSASLIHPTRPPLNC